MTQRQRKAKAKRAGARRRKVNAAVTAWRKMNPGKRLPAAVRVKRLTGGGFSITPVKVNLGIRKIMKRERVRQGISRKDFPTSTEFMKKLSPQAKYRYERTLKRSGRIID